MASKVAASLAVLIDLDNAAASSIGAILKEAAKHGTPLLRRAYGDWTSTSMQSWKGLLLSHSIQPKQQFAYTTGKNASDMAMTIDAMDLVHSNRFSGFCLVSSDSDFTPLAVRIRDSGMSVYGFGHKRTPLPFVMACNKFTYVEDIASREQLAAPQANPATTVSPPQKDASSARESPPQKDASSARESPPQKDISSVTLDSPLGKMLQDAVESASDEEGWAYLNLVHYLIIKQNPDFDSRRYGKVSFGDFLKDTGLFDITTQHLADRPMVFARDKRLKQSTGAGTQASPAPTAPLKHSLRLSSIVQEQNPQLEEMVRDAIKSASPDQTGWVALPQVKSYLREEYPGFTLRKFGFLSIGHLVTALGFVRETRQTPDGVKVNYVCDSSPAHSTDAGTVIDNGYGLELEAPLASPTVTPAPQERIRSRGQLEETLQAAVAKVSNREGWAYLADVKGFILRRDPSFHSHRFKHAKFEDLVAATGLFDVERRVFPVGKGHGVGVYLRDKRFERSTEAVHE
ncbi:hypothetical protein LZ32DRAFT_608481 [Colletotrichum eremochloae]|nr:hypothetical protein LZ32DRAFT_608481 [Colletotrichum eremochloae]